MVYNTLHTIETGSKWQKPIHIHGDRTLSHNTLPIFMNVSFSQLLFYEIHCVKRKVLSKNNESIIQSIASTSNELIKHKAPS